MPMVMNAQKMAANADAIWVRAVLVIFHSFIKYRLFGDISNFAESVPVYIKYIKTIV
jgi:hypothetical protein